MENEELIQCIDFMHIGLTELEKGNEETAKGFFEDVNKKLLEANEDE